MIFSKNFSLTKIKFSLAIIWIWCSLLIICSCYKNNVLPSKKDACPDYASLIIDQDFNLREPIIELMRLTNIDISYHLRESIATTQQAWLRPLGSERDHLSESHTDQVDIMHKQFDRLGLINELIPKKNEYDYVLILGATYKTFRNRLKFLERILANGIKIKTLVLLGSLRPLEKAEIKAMSKDYEISGNLLTEIDMMQTLLQKSFITKTKPNIQIKQVTSLMKKCPGGSIIRANTRDTVKDFLSLKLKPGSALIISSQPYVIRQDLVIRSVLGPIWQIETVGPLTELNLPTDVYLDELARILYELRDYFSVYIIGNKSLFAKYHKKPTDYH